MNPPSAAPLLGWTVHLARLYPGRAVVSLISIAAATALGFAIAGPYVAVVVAVAMVISLADFLFPVRYILTAEGASCRMLMKGTEIKWADVKRCYMDDLGVKLSPLDRVSRLEAFRGVYLRFGGNRDEVVDAVRALRQPQDATTGDTDA